MGYWPTRRDVLRTRPGYAYITRYNEEIVIELGERIAAHAERSDWYSALNRTPWASTGGRRMLVANPLTSA